jgi:hypothetical protein
LSLRDILTALKEEASKLQQQLDTARAAMKLVKQENKAKVEKRRVYQQQLRSDNCFPVFWSLRH